MNTNKFRLLIYIERAFNRFPDRLKSIISEPYLGVKMRVNVKRAHARFGIIYRPIEGRFPLRVRRPPDFWVEVIFPNGEISRIHLTEERGYEDLDGTAHIGCYSNFVNYVYPLVGKELAHGHSLIIDCACGSGYGSYFLATKLRRPVMGIDVDAGTVEYASRRYSRLCPDLTYICANVMNLDEVKSDSVSAITSIETIEHVPDPDKALREFRRVLKSKGVLYITTPDASEHPGKMHSSFHLREYTPTEFSELLNQNFRYIKVSVNHNRIIGLCSNGIRVADMKIYLAC